MLVFAYIARHLTVHIHDTRDLEFDRSFGIFHMSLAFILYKKHCVKIGYAYTSCNVKPQSDMLH